MPQYIVWQVQTEVDARESNVPLEYLLNCPTTAQVPLTEWAETSTINLRVTTQLELSYDIAPGDQTYNNPTEFRAGTAAYSCNGYTFHRDYITFERQLHNYDLPPVSVAGAIASAPIVLEATANTRRSHAYSIATVGVCGSVEGSPIEPNPLPSSFSGTIGAGSICLAIEPGALELAQKPSIIDDAYSLDLNLADYFHSYSVSGICRAGFYLVVRTTLYYLHEIADLPYISVGIPLQGEAPFPVYTYACIDGTPVPSPTNQPCGPSEIRVVYNAAGNRRVICGGG
jgi:hypothetical protein